MSANLSVRSHREALTANAIASQLHVRHNYSLPAALLVVAPHKTGSTFIAAFLTGLSSGFKTCLYTDNARNGKCSSSGCGREGIERQYPTGKTAWGECTTFITGHLRSMAHACTPLRTAPSCPAIYRRGFVWGPCRTTSEIDAAFGLVRTHASTWQPYYFLHQRHPWDAALSAYYSYGFTHSPPRNATGEDLKAYRAYQLSIQNQTVDQYVLSVSHGFVAKYEPSLKLLESPPPGAVLIRSRYEDMVLYFAQWLQQILAQLEISFSRAQRTALQLSLLKEHASAFSPNGVHKRTITPGSSLRELKKETIAAMNEKHHDIMVRLGYL